MDKKNSFKVASELIRQSKDPEIIKIRNAGEGDASITMPVREWMMIRLMLDAGRTALMQFLRDESIIDPFSCGCGECEPQITREEALSTLDPMGTSYEHLLENIHNLMPSNEEIEKFNNLFENFQRLAEMSPDDGTGTVN